MTSTIGLVKIKFISLYYSHTTLSFPVKTYMGSQALQIDDIQMGVSYLLLYDFPVIQYDI